MCHLKCVILLYWESAGRGDEVCLSDLGGLLIGVEFSGVVSVVALCAPSNAGDGSNGV